MKKQNYKTKYPIVFIVYRDSAIWHKQEPIDRDFPLYIFNVAGFLIQNNKDNYVVSREVATSHKDDLRGILAIPKENVVHFEIVQKVKHGKSKKS